MYWNIFGRTGIFLGGEWGAGVGVGGVGLRVGIMR